jgi:hypothetical protein
VLRERAVDSVVTAASHEPGDVYGFRLKLHGAVEVVLAFVRAIRRVTGDTVQAWIGGVAPFDGQT